MRGGEVTVVPEYRAPQLWVGVLAAWPNEERHVRHRHADVTGTWTPQATPEPATEVLWVSIAGPE